VIDVKTSPRINDEVALQLVGYARADFVGLDDGTEAPLLPDPYRVTTSGRPAKARDPIEYGVAVRPTPSGKYETVTFALTDALFAGFLAVLGVAQVDPERLASQARRPS